MDIHTGLDVIVAKYNAQKAANPEKIPCLAFSLGAATGMQNNPLSTALSILCTKKESATNELTIVQKEADYDNVDKCLVSEFYDLFMISIDGAVPPNTVIDVYDYSECNDETRCNNLTKAGKVHLERADGWYDGNGLHGVSIKDKIETSMSSDKLYENWIAVRETGTLDFGKSCVPNADYPLLKLKEMMNDIVARNGAIIIFNDAWWETTSPYGRYFDNIYLENMGEFVNMIWSLPSTQNVWLIYRTPYNERILTPWDNGLYGERAFCLGRGDGRVSSMDTRWYAFDGCLRRNTPCAVTPRIGLKPHKNGFETFDKAEIRKPISNGGKRRRKTSQKRRVRARQTQRRRNL